MKTVKIFLLLTGLFYAASLHANVQHDLLPKVPIENFVSPAMLPADASPVTVYTSVGVAWGFGVAYVQVPEASPLQVQLAALGSGYIKQERFTVMKGAYLPALSASDLSHYPIPKNTRLNRLILPDKRGFILHQGRSNTTDC